MSKRALRAVALGAAVLSIGVGAYAVSGADARNFRASPLTGFEENPDLSTTGRGSWSARLSSNGTTLSYTLRFSNLEGNVTQSHIHFGKRAVNAGIVIWLCQTSTNMAPTADIPTCPAPGGTISGQVTAEDVLAPANPPQGIEPGAFNEVIAAMRAGHAYVNVHSSKFPGGEIRAQIRVVR
jgi:hypothetical protein